MSFSIPIFLHFFSIHALVEVERGGVAVVIAKVSLVLIWQQCEIFSCYFHRLTVFVCGLFATVNKGNKRFRQLCDSLSEFLLLPCPTP